LVNIIYELNIKVNKMTTNSQKLLKEIEELWVNHFQRVNKDRKELEGENISTER